jgi:hypothetical protein
MRIIFWTTYVLGILILLFSFLLAQVPQPPHRGDFTLDYAVRSLAAGFLLTAILLARRLWNINDPIPSRGRVSARGLVFLTAWVGLVIAVAGVIGLAIARR